MTRSPRPAAVARSTGPPALTRPRSEVAAQLQGRIERGKGILNRQNTYSEREALKTDLTKWRDYNCDLLKQLFTDESLYSEYHSACFPSRAAHGVEDAFTVQLETVPHQLSKLESIVERLELYSEPIDEPVSAATAAAAVAVRDLSKVFVVHGHDEGAREAVARFIQVLGFRPIILHESANEGRTVIEKVEAYGDVGFAVVLLTPDDEGRANGGTLAPRARQNVLLELGYFIGRLGRNHVCALKRGDLEIPSDFGGVVYEPFDTSGGWKLALGRELKAAGFAIDWNKVHE
jgi:predicted nucleotide-binding protein